MLRLLPSFSESDFRLMGSGLCDRTLGVNMESSVVLAEASVGNREGGSRIQGTLRNSADADTGESA